jgi:hypothetical protein
MWRATLSVFCASAQSRSEKQFHEYAWEPEGGASEHLPSLDFRKKSKFKNKKEKKRCLVNNKTVN